VLDLLWHLPRGTIDRRHAPPVAATADGMVATLTVRVLEHRPGDGPRRPYRVRCGDDTGEITLVFFNARPDYLLSVLPPQATRIVSGTVEVYGDALQMAHPDYIVSLADRASLPQVEPLYALTTGLTAKLTAKLVRRALERAPALPEWIGPDLRAGQGWPSWREALVRLHRPDGTTVIGADGPCRQRLAYDELLANQLALALVRRRISSGRGRPIAAAGRMAAAALDAFGSRLTASQSTALAEIQGDMAADGRMLRLLQGDVGSGKTLVALLAMLTAVESGAQAALMAPTEILARQHQATVAPLAKAAGVQVALLTGSDRARERKVALAGLAAGTTGIALGTHALLEDEVAFADLALVVIDEQHRFGVHQRLDLAAKGKAADVLVMTATPIPRTLMMTAYGDLDVSRLTEKPPGRGRIDTRTIPLDRLDEVVEAVGRSLAAGARTFWVCPLVADSEAIDLAAAEERFRHLAAVFGAGVGLVHGRMKGKDREQTLGAFREGSIGLLVATTVIEVGVDVPEATVMVIEHAERFGLAQLHQLRGRIGRGAGASTCLLLYAPPLNPTARARLSILRETDDGFRIAEEDLRLRGPGEVLGIRQSGLPDFRLVSFPEHAELFPMARDEARRVLDQDPQLSGPRGEALRLLLYLFERDTAIRYLRSG
jgi:ATP-dependent DNA helicase RecG